MSDVERDLRTLDKWVTFLCVALPLLIGLTQCHDSRQDARLDTLEDACGVVAEEVVDP